MNTAKGAASEPNLAVTSLEWHLLISAVEVCPLFSMLNHTPHPHTKIISSCCHQMQHIAVVIIHTIVRLCSPPSGLGMSQMPNLGLAGEAVSNLSQDCILHHVKSCKLPFCVLLVLFPTGICLFLYNSGNNRWPKLEMQLHRKPHVTMSVEYCYCFLCLQKKRAWL